MVFVLICRVYVGICNFFLFFELFELATKPANCSGTYHLMYFRSASSLTSMVMCPDHPGLTFNLSLVRNDPTYNQPIQQWTFISDFAVSNLF